MLSSLNSDDCRSVSAGPSVFLGNESTALPATPARSLIYDPGCLIGVDRFRPSRIHAA